MINGSRVTIGGWFNQAPEQVVISGGHTNYTTLDILHRVAWLQSKMRQDEIKTCALFTSDTPLFVATFMACACTGVTLVLPANNTDDFIQAVDADWFVGDWPNAVAVDFSALEPFLPKHLSEGFEVVVFTSGSTGEPKRISRGIQQLLIEVRTLQGTFGEECGLTHPGGIFAATVSHQHIYGLLFKILWPLLTGQVIWHKIIAFEESLEDLLDKFQRVVLISSPAFLKRIHGQFQHKGHLLRVYSSGGMLSDKQQKLAEHKLNTKITQVYGSSETGGIAHRQLNQSWQLFSAVETQIKNEVLWVNSPFCYQSGWLCTQDKISASAKGFELLGRNDRIVKIEEKRVSLSRVEDLLRAHLCIVDAAVVALENGRQFLAALVVLSHTGQQQLGRIGQLKLKQSIKQHLSTQLDAVAIPRKISFTTESLENTQGKRIIADLARRLL